MNMGTRKNIKIHIFVRYNFLKLEKNILISI